MTTPKPVEHFFRYEYGRLVAMLSRRVGVQYIEAVEDAVQSALMTALDTRTIAGLLDDPSAWLFRVAHNDLMGELRQRTRRRRILEQNAREDIDTLEDGPETFFADEVRDDLLRMLFVCCDEAIPLESQLVLALKILCGFDTREIALRLFTSEANVYKRLGRARSRLRELPLRPGELAGEQCFSRLPAVHKILYLLFTEGYLSSHAEMAIRRELCDEAMRPAALLGEHPVGQSPETFALLAQRLRTTDLAGRLLSMGCRTGRFASALRKRPYGEALSGCSVEIGSYSGSEAAPAATTPDRPPRLKRRPCASRSTSGAVTNGGYRGSLPPLPIPPAPRRSRLH